MKKITERIDVKVAAKIAYFCGEIHTFVLSLLCNDDGISTTERLKRIKELREAMVYRCDILVSAKASKHSYKKKQSGGKSNSDDIVYASVMRPSYSDYFMAAMRAIAPALEDSKFCSIIEDNRVKRYNRDSTKTAHGRMRNKQAQERRLRTGEILAMMYRANIRLACEILLKGGSIPKTCEEVESPIFFRPRELQLEGEDREHIKLTRTHGVLYTMRDAFVVFNIDTAATILKSASEVRYYYMLSRTRPYDPNKPSLMLIGRDTNGPDNIDNMHIAREYLKDRMDVSKKKVDFAKSIRRIYKDVYYLPKDLNGIRMLRILCVPNYWERLCEALGIVPVKYEEGYDAIDGDGRRITHFFTGNLESLARIVDTYVYGKNPRLIYIFTWQERFVVDALRIMGVFDRNNNRYAQADYNPMQYCVCSMDKVEKVLGLPAIPSFYRQHEDT